MPFPVTRWTLLARATVNGDTAARSALEEFCRDYRAPLTEFACYQGLAHPQAEDVVQEFLIHITQESMLRRANREHGRFRSFLVGALKRFISRHRKREQALKRGGKAVSLSLDVDAAEAEIEVSISGAETAFFDRRWAIALLERAVSEVEGEYRARERETVLAAVIRFLPGNAAPPSYEEGAAAAGMSLAQFKTEVHRVRARLRECLRVLVSQTVTAPHEVEEEMAYLGRVLSHTSPSEP